MLRYFVDPIYDVILHSCLLSFGSFNNTIFKTFNCFICFIDNNFGQASTVKRSKDGQKRTNKATAQQAVASAVNDYRPCTGHRVEVGDGWPSAGPLLCVFRGQSCWL